jgi:hypothetical protein
MKIIRWIAWGSAGIAVLILIIAAISFFTSTLFGNISHGAVYFHAANSFLLLSIALFIASKHCCCDKCTCEEEKKEG